MGYTWTEGGFIVFILVGGDGAGKTIFANEDKELDVIKRMHEQK